MTPTARAATHTALFYSALFGGFGAYLPFWPVWLEDWGLGQGEVGIYLSFGVLVRVVAGFAFPILADRLDERRLMTVILSLIGALLFLWHLGIETRPALMIGTIATGAAIAGTGPLGEALGNAAARRHGFAYARPRAVGSAAFLVANVLVGIGIARLGTNVALWWIVAFMVLTAALAWRHPGGGHVASTPPSLAEIRRLMTAPVFVLFVATAALINASHATYYAYSSVHWRSLGLSEDVIGLLWAFSVAAEVAFMMVLGTRVVARLGPIGTLALGGGAALFRWICMMWDPGLIWLWPLQALHALTFGAALLGAMAFIAAAVPERYGASAQGAHLGFAGGLLTALGMWIAAAIYPHVGGFTYGIGIVFAALSLGCAWALARRWRGETLNL